MGVYYQGSTMPHQLTVIITTTTTLFYLACAIRAHHDINPSPTAAEAWLRNNMMPFDRPNAATYFDGGIANTAVNASLTARQELPFAHDVPIDIWYDAVLPYAVVNEARTNWRQLLQSKLYDFVKNNTNASTTLSEAATLVNDHMWSMLSLDGTSIKFKSEQTPLIYDPMSTMA